MTLGVRIRGRRGRRDLHEEVFDGPYEHDMDADWQAARLTWGFGLADGRRVTNVDPSPYQEQPNQDHHRSARSADRDYWLWPLPPPGGLRWRAGGWRTTSR